MSSTKSKYINQNRLIRVFKDTKALNSTENRFCFLIGAGASKSSGIKTGWELSEDWYNDLKTDLSEEERLAWEEEIGFEEDKIGEFYPFLYRKRYEISPQLGYDEFKKIMEHIEPGLGYVILSQILANEKHNFVITTNFDYLIEDAVRMYTSTKPFSAGHETLAEFISSQTERPTIIKVHRDLFLHPFNDTTETEKLKEEWKRALKPILKNFNLLVVGYGGNDGSLMDYLKSIKSEDRKSIYWCVRDSKSLNSRIDDLLTEKDFIVEISSFDELMFALNDVFGYKIFEKLDDIQNHPFVVAAKERILGLDKKRKDLLENFQRKEKKVPKETKDIFTGPMKVMLEAYLEKDINKKEEIYNRGLVDYSDDANFIGDYAVFLKNIRKEYEKAEEYFEKAIALNPENVYNIENYALFLTSIRKEYQKAEEYFEKAVELDPKDAINIGNYAVFLTDIRKEYQKAEEYYQKAIALDSKNANNIGNYAHYLIVSKQDFENAEKNIDKSFEIAEKDAFGLLAELWFYRYAHYSKWQKKGEKELNKLVSKGAKSIGMNLKPHITIAKQNKTSDIKKLEKFEKLITE